MCSCNSRIATAHDISTHCEGNVQPPRLHHQVVLCAAAAAAAAARRVAVEVDGPAHFTNSLPHSLLGSSLAKQRCLQARGWAVLSLPYYTWSELAQQQQQQQQVGVELQRAPPAGPPVLANTGKTLAAAAGNRNRSVQSRPVPSSSSSSSSADSVAAEHPSHAAGSDEAAAAAAAVLQAQAQWLAAALDEAVAMADVPKGMPHLRQLIEDAVV
jgi:hypothetical protein